METALGDELARVWAAGGVRAFYVGLKPALVRTRTRAHTHPHARTHTQSYARTRTAARARGARTRACTSLSSR